MAAAGFVFEHALVAVVAAGTFYAAGRLALRTATFANLAEEVGFCVALGMGICGTVLFCLALAGLFTRTAVILLLILIHLLGIPVWGNLARRLRARRPGWLLGLPPLLVFCVPEFWLGLFPPHEFDETMYHLPFAKAFAIGHSVEFLPSLRNPVFPQLVESIFGALLACADDVSCHFVEMLAMAAAATALFGVAARFGTRRAGLLAACAWLGSPLVVTLSSICHVDLTLTLFVSLSVLAWEIHHASGDRTFLALAGALAGFAAGTKYLGLPFLVCIPLLTAAFGARGRKRSEILVVLAFGLAAAFPFYLWITASTGNPVFPFLPQIFGASDWAKTGYFNAAQRASLTGLRLFLEPWKTFLVQRSASTEALLSAALLPLIPFAVVAAVKWPRHRRGVGLAVLCSVVAGAVDVRFLLLTLPLLCLAAADGLDLSIFSARAPATDAMRSALAASIALALALPGILFADGKVRKQPPLCIGPAERNAYLRSQLPAYGALEWLRVNAGRRDRVYGLYAENMAYFASGEIFGDWRGPARYATIVPTASNPRRLARVLRAWGAAFLLFDGSRGYGRSLRDPERFHEYFEPVYRNGDVLLYRIREPPRASDKM